MSTAPSPSGPPPPISEHHTRRRIEFADTDTAGIVHFARFFIFMETAEHELLRAAGTEVHTEVDGVAVGWPRVAAECEYSRPVRFPEVLDIHTRVARKGERSLTFEHTFRRDGEVVARGRMSSVCCRLGGDAPASIPIPEPLARRLAVVEG